jgi:hypothetical protein
MLSELVDILGSGLAARQDRRDAEGDGVTLWRRAGADIGWVRLTWRDVEHAVAMGWDALEVSTVGTDWSLLWVDPEDRSLPPPRMTPDGRQVWRVSVARLYHDVTSWNPPDEEPDT